MNRLDTDKPINLPFIVKEVTVRLCEIRLDEPVDGAVLKIENKVRFVDDESDTDGKRSYRTDCTADIE